MPFVTAVMVAAIASSFTASQERKLARAIICPEHLPTDAARLRNVEYFDRLYAGFAPQSRAGERMAMREKLLLQKKCAPNSEQQQYTFPQE